MIAALALELLLIGLAVWQLVVLRRSLRADSEREKDGTGKPEGLPPSCGSERRF